LAAANATLATYQQSQKEGKRVLNSVQHDAATQAAGGELDSAKQTVADATANVKQITDEVAGHDKDVADDEALAKNPPANLAGDDRSNYIDARKNDAQTARDAATDARSRLKDAQKSLDDAKAALATVQGKLEHPDVPGTDEERAAIKQQNEQAIAGAKATINLDQKAIKSLKDALAAVPMTVDESQTRGGPTTIVKLDPDNLAIVQKHLAEYLTVVGASEVPKTK